MFYYMNLPENFAFLLLLKKWKFQLPNPSLIQTQMQRNDAISSTSLDSLRDLGLSAYSYFPITLFLVAAIRPAKH